MTDSYRMIARIKPFSNRVAEETVELTRKTLKKSVCYQTYFATDSTGAVMLPVFQPLEQFYYGNPNTDIGKIVQEEEMLPPSFLPPHNYRMSLREQGGLREVWRRLTTPIELGIYEKLPEPITAVSQR